MEEGERVVVGVRGGNSVGYGKPLFGNTLWELGRTWIKTLRYKTDDDEQDGSS